MIWHKLRSRAISLVGYDFEAGRLIVRFNGRVFYAYENVPYAVLEAFAKAEVPGALINDHLRGRRFSGKTVGFRALTTLLAVAQASGMRSIGRGPYDYAPRSILRLSAAQMDDLCKYLDSDDDCEGNHLWVDIGRDAVGDPLVWHVNEATGLIVPPTPCVLRKAVGRRPPPQAK